LAAAAVEAMQLGQQEEAGVSAHAGEAPSNLYLPQGTGAFAFLYIPHVKTP